jgi:hypothetical protein
MGRFPLESWCAALRTDDHRRSPWLSSSQLKRPFGPEGKSAKRIERTRACKAGDRPSSSLLWETPDMRRLQNSRMCMPDKVRSGKLPRWAGQKSKGGCRRKRELRRESSDVTMKQRRCRMCMHCVPMNMVIRTDWKAMAMSSAVPNLSGPALRFGKAKGL